MAMARMAKTCWALPIRWGRTCRIPFSVAQRREKYGGNPFGFQWFPSRGDGSSGRRRSGPCVVIGALNAFLDARLAEEGLGPSTGLVGFSQGSMISLHIAPRRDAAIAGGGFGRLLAPERLRPRKVNRVLLAHGDRTTVPCRYVKGRQRGRGQGLVTVMSWGTGHGVRPAACRWRWRFCGISCRNRPLASYQCDARGALTLHRDIVGLVSVNTPYSCLNGAGSRLGANGGRA